MKRKFARIAAIVLALVLVLAACGEEKTSINVEKTLTHQLSEEEVTFTLFAKKLDDYYGQDVFTEAFKMTNVMLEPFPKTNQTHHRPWRFPLRQEIWQISSLQTETTSLSMVETVRLSP